MVDRLGGTEAGVIRVYSYGAFPPVDGTERIEDQMRLAARYRNKLVELRHEHRVIREALCGSEAEDRAARFRAYGAATRLARGVSGLFWGTYLEIEKSVQKAERFARYDGAGALTVQIQSTRPLSDWTTDSRVQMRPWPEGIPVRPGQDSTRGPKLVNSSGPLMEVRMRIGSDGRAPIWGVWPVRLHRPLPDDARVTWVHARRRRQGRRLDWTIEFVIETAAPAQSTGDSAPRIGSVGLDLGWRKMPDGSLRCAYGVDNVGAVFDLRLPPRDVEALAWIDRFGAGRDNHLNEYRHRLVAFLLERGDERDTTAARWKSADRFARAISHARRQAPLPGEIAAWLKQDRHLCDAEAGARGNLIARRNQTLHGWAKRLCTYAEVRIEKFDQRRFAREHEDDGPAATNIRHLRNLAAPGILKQCLLSRAERDGTRVIEVVAKDTTRRCHLCGHVNEWNDATPRMLRCADCGAEWDQDHNAAINILRASGEVCGKGSDNGSRRLSKRQSRMRGGARKPVDNSAKPVEI